MAKIHNQKKLEDSITKCDTQGASMIEKTAELRHDRALLAGKNSQAVLDYIFGKSDENPLADISNEINELEEYYRLSCETMTTETLNSRN